jgi:hypothetical protein
VSNSPGVTCATSESWACAEALELEQEMVSVEVPETAVLFRLNKTVCAAVLLRLKTVELAMTPEGMPLMLQETVELNPLAGTRLTGRLWLPLAVSSAPAGTEGHRVGPGSSRYHPSQAVQDWRHRKD